MEKEVKHFVFDVIPYYVRGNESMVGSDGVLGVDRSTFGQRWDRNELYFKVKNEKNKD
jgi:hypothetical protein